MYRSVLMSKKPVVLHLDQEQLAALGLFAAHWAYFETEMDFTISAMTFAVYHNQEMPFSFDDRIKQWKKVLLQLTKSRTIIKRYEAIIKNAKAAHDTRSKFLHARVIGDPQRRTRAVCFEHNRHRMGEWRVRPIVVTPRKVQAIARAIGELTTSLINLNRRHLRISPQSLPCIYPAPPRDGPSLMRRGHSGSSALKNQPQSSRA